METQKPAAREIGMASLSPLIEEILKNGGAATLTVTGSSMRPMLRHQVSRVRLVPVTELKRGDLPLYRRDNGQYVLHRIVDVNADGTFTCCGDNQWHLEKGLRREQMIAVVDRFSRKGDDRWVSGNDWKYRLYWHLWLAIRPLRRIIFGGWRRVKRVLKASLCKGSCR